jgi:hypothetical protein
MTGRTATLTFEGQESELVEIPAGCAQGYPISPMLFLFYNMELLEIFNSSEAPVQSTGFVDDVNLLAYGRTPEINCANLSRIHDQCLQWARRHGAKFAPKTYHLIHLSRRQRRFNMTASICLGDVTVNPVDSTRILGAPLGYKATMERTPGQSSE